MFGCLNNISTKYMSTVITVSRLLQLCQKKGSNGAYYLDSNRQCAIISLGVYLVESNFKFGDKILPELLNIQKKLAKCTMPIDTVPKRTKSLPDAECFAFCLSSLLTQVAMLQPSHFDKLLCFSEEFFHTSSGKESSFTDILAALDT
ncbi:unnamed protein product [Dibothriocephalus latus]|uniref:Uncharacterized protein n=1 Tax=Dibothriocephalus latus TaxID=60516 RepID=A0A3P7PAX1_DIBLA|nr:unnamed protein product [Dibothriocephalus latus]